MAVNQWTSAGLSLRAVIDGVAVNDIVEFSSVFELNNIPMARILLAVGRNTRTLKAATAHSLAAKLKIHSPVKVYLKVTQKSASPGKSRKWPGEFVVFDGYAVGSGYIRSREGAFFSISLVHWLSDLNAASAVSATSHPYNPADFTFGAAAPLAVNTAGGQQPGWTPMSLAQTTITSGKLATDFWQEVLHPWLLDVAKNDNIDTQVFGASSGGNQAAIAALNRMRGDNSGGKYVPLAMNLGTNNSTAIVAGIRGALRNETQRSWANTTLWGKLIGDWAPSYMFAVVPRIEDALIIPHAYSLKQTYKTISGDDFSQCQINGTLPQVLRAVGIFAAVGSQAGGSDDPTKYPVAFNRLAGLFPQKRDDPNAKGIVMIKGPPPWLSDPAVSQQYSRASTGAESKEPISTVFTPGAGSNPPADAGTPEENYKAFYANDGLLDRYAHQWYVIEMLKGRMGELSGMLRFDIAPGTSVKIEAAADRMLGSQDKLGKTYYAHVSRVTHMINSETRIVGTAFALDHIRDQKENDDGEEKYSISKPPLYSKAYPGAGLSNQFT